MSVVIRLARAGTKKRPVYHIVVADSRFPRDGRFIERLGYFNPLLPKDNETRLKLDLEKVKAWMAKGAQPSDRVMRFLDAAGVAKREPRNNPQKAIPRKERGKAAEGARRADGVSLAPRRGVGARICIAKFGAAHGVRGEIRLWPFTEDPLSVTGYGPLETADGKRRFEIATARAAKDHLVARIKGIDTRDDAEKLNGLDLFVAREKLPATDDDEFYHADLIGLAAVTAAGEPLGRIFAVHNFGAGDIIEIAPATAARRDCCRSPNAVVPTVDLAGRRAVIVLPDEIEGDDPDSADA